MLLISIINWIADSSAGRNSGVGVTFKNGPLRDR